MGKTPILDNTINKSESTELETFDFQKAIRHIMMGDHVAKKSWDNNDYCLYKDGWLQIFRSEEQKFHSWLISEGDMFGDDDWYVVKKANIG